MMHHIFIASTEWGGTKGGINLFNKFLVEALARVLGDEVTLHSVVANAETIPAGTVPGIRFYGYDGTGIGLAAVIEPILSEGKRKLERIYVFGHDVHTGPHAIEARDRLKAKGYAIRAATFCHMDYSAYDYLKDTRPEAILDKAEKQRHLVCAADDVYAVGPLLTRNFSQLRNERDEDGHIHSIIPGFPEAFVAKSFDNPSSALSFFFSGRIDPSLDRLKNSRLVLKALVKAYQGDTYSLTSRWQQRGHFYCYGFAPGPADRVWYSDSIDDAAVGGRFTLHMEDFGDQQVMFRQLADSHVAIMPSTHEGFGLSGWEALCAGIPLICSDQSGLAMFLDACFEDDHDLPGESVITIRLTDSPADVDVLAKAVHHITRAYDRRRSHAKALASHLRERYSWDDCARTVASAINLVPIGSVNWADRQYDGKKASQRNASPTDRTREVEQAVLLANQGRGLSEWSLTCTALNYLSDISKRPSYASLDSAQRQLAEIAKGFALAYAADLQAQPILRASGRFDVAWRFMAASSGLSPSLSAFLQSHPGEMMEDIRQDSFLRRELLHYATKYQAQFDGISELAARDLFRDLAAICGNDDAFQTRFARLESSFPNLASFRIFDAEVHVAYRDEKRRCDTVRRGSFDLNDLLVTQGTLGPTALALSTIDRGLADGGWRMAVLNNYLGQGANMGTSRRSVNGGAISC